MVMDSPDADFGLHILPDGSCLIVQTFTGPRAGLKMLLLESDGTLRWSRLVEQPRELQNQQGVTKPQIAISGDSIQLVWPPLGLQSEDLFPPPGITSLSRTAWFAEIAASDGLSRAWQLRLPDYGWLFAEQFGGQAGGFAMYEALRGHLLLLEHGQSGFHMRSFIVPDFIRSAQGEYDLQQRLVRVLQSFAGDGAALLLTSERGQSAESGLAGFLAWDKNMSQVLVGLPGALPSGFNVPGSSLFATDQLTYFALRLDQRLVGLPAGALLVSGDSFEQLTGTYTRLAVEEPELPVDATAYSLRLATIAGFGVEMLGEPEYVSGGSAVSVYRLSRLPSSFAGRN